MPTVLRADHGRVRQVLLNYLSNAVKFTERGSVVVQVSAAALDNAHQRVRIAVRDTGIGIAAGNRSEEHTSELQSLMRISYAVFCLKKKTTIRKHRSTMSTLHTQQIDTKPDNISVTSLTTV